jgi:selenoprotein W-related protein
VAAELLDNYTQAIASLKLIPSSGGRFEVLADVTPIYSKKAEGRHAQDGEVMRLFGEKLRIEPVEKG